MGRCLGEFQLSKGGGCGGLSGKRGLGFTFTFTLTRRPGLLLLSRPKTGFSRAFHRRFRRVLERFATSKAGDIVLSARVASSISQFTSCLLLLGGNERLLCKSVRSIHSTCQVITNRHRTLETFNKQLICVRRAPINYDTLIGRSRTRCSQTLGI